MIFMTSQINLIAAAMRFLAHRNDVIDQAHDLHERLLAE